MKFDLSPPLQIEYLLPNLLGMFYVSIELQLVYCTVTVANEQNTTEIKDSNPVSSYLFTVSLPPIRLSPMVSRLLKSGGLSAMPLLLVFLPPNPLVSGCAQRTSVC